MSWANGYKFELSDVGRIDQSREVPEFTLVRRPREKNPQPGKEKRVDVVLRFEQGGELTLGELEIYPDKDERPPDSKIPDWLGGRYSVMESTVVAGWLAGAEDLLLVAWTDNRGGLATSKDGYRGTAILRMSGDEPEILLRDVAHTAVRLQHMDYPGIYWHKYEFDPEREMLIDRIRTRGQSTASLNRPLHHWNTERKIRAKFRAVIQQVFTRRYRYSDGQLERASIDLHYITQEGDTAKAIARFYLGPLAPAEAIHEANPKLREREGERGALPQGVRVRIPAPESWLLHTWSRWFR